MSPRQSNFFKRPLLDIKKKQMRSSSTCLDVTPPKYKESKAIAAIKNSSRLKAHHHYMSGDSPKIVTAY